MAKKILATLLMVFVGFAVFATGTPETPGTTGGVARETPASGAMESPMLAEQVAAGELPPVEDRIPADPWVVEPVDELGQYGGTYRTYFGGPGDWAEYGHMLTPYMLYISRTYDDFIPMIAKSFLLSPDAQTLTIQLREGMKWSNGDPVTADDIMFWWNAQVTDPDLKNVYGWMAGAWQTQGEDPTFIKVNDHTVRIEFSAPNRPILATLASWRGGLMTFIVPSEYLSRFHIRYNEDANELAEAAEMESWVDLYQAKNNWPGPGYNDPEMPTLAPWVLVSQDTSARIYERNPYFWAVDTEGRQLPYIDRIEAELVSDANVRILKGMNGELDTIAKITNLNDLGLYRQNESRGDYQTYLYESSVTSWTCIGFNQNHPDPVKREVFQDLRFRQAMSAAIDREEINQIVYNGLGEPGQVSVHRTASYFEPEWAEAYAEYDPDQANDLLDQMGLNERTRDGWRLGPDGTVLELDIRGGGSPTMELIKGYWEEVGIKTNLVSMSHELYVQRYQAAELDAGVWGADRMLEFAAYIPNATKFAMDSEVAWAIKWDAWWKSQRGITSSGEGEEPPQFIKDYLDTLEAWSAAGTDAEYTRLAKEVWEFHAENLYLIGTVGYTPSAVMVNNRLGNVPEDLIFVDELAWWQAARPVQWYIKQE